MFKSNIGLGSTCLPHLQPIGSAFDKAPLFGIPDVVIPFGQITMMKSFEQQKLGSQRHPSNLVYPPKDPTTPAIVRRYVISRNTV